MASASAHPVVARLRAVLASPWTRAVVLVVALGVAAVNLQRVPDADVRPVLLGLSLWVVGKYVLCPLRWHALSAGGRTRRWHLRVYAESELFGLLSPAHAGADLWRAHRLNADAGMDRPSALADVALDRLVGAVGLSVFVVAAGAALPPQVLVAALGIAAVVLTAALVVKRHRLKVLASRPAPRPRAIVSGLLLSMGYQLSILALLLGAVGGVGHSVDLLLLLGVFGASQAAGVVPGVHGAGPREGALVAGLVALGLPFGAALGAVSMTSVVAWLPASLLGGSALALRRAAERRARAALPAPAAVAA